MIHSDNYNAEFGISPAQYHACLDKLWAVLPKDRKGPPYTYSVFDRIVEYVRYLENNSEITE